MAIVIEKITSDTSKDLLYAILKALGGTMADVKKIYFSTSDDLLYAILERLSNGSVMQVVADFVVEASDYDGKAYNYPALIGATKVIVITAGGLLAPGVSETGRYYLVNTTTDAIEVPQALEPGDIFFSSVTAGETILILKS